MKNADKEIIGHGEYKYAESTCQDGKVYEIFNFCKLKFIIVRIL